MMSEALPNNGVLIGYNTHESGKSPAYLSDETRSRHVHIIGKAGTGKSTLLNQMIKQDIQAGKGVCVLDPEGDLIDQILTTIPQNRQDDIIVFDPSDTTKLMGFNILEHESEDEKYVITTGIIDMMYKLFDPHRAGIIRPIFEHAVRNAIYTAMCEPDASFAEAIRCVTDYDYVKTILPKVKDPSVLDYWAYQMARTPQQIKADNLDDIVSKLGKFVTNDIIHRAIGQPKSAFNLREIMDNNKILLINLSKKKLGEENSVFIGLLMVSRILGAAIARVNTPQEKRKLFFLYMDEFQNFATPNLAIMLSEARVYKLALTVVSQFMDQIEDDVRKAVFSNINTQIVFQTGNFDAEFLVRVFNSPITIDDLISQPRYHAYVNTIVNSKPILPFSINTNIN